MRNDGESKKFNRASNKEFIKADRSPTESLAIVAPIVSWYRNNQLIKPSKYFRMESSPDGTHSLSILEAFPEDSGNYRCVARNKAGETTCGSLLKVQGQ